jgi:hypothetical protein
MTPPPLGLLGTDGLTARGAAWAVALLVVTFLGSIVVVAVLLVRMPATYFLDDGPRVGWGGRHPVLRWAALIVKNLVGVVLVAVGVLMLVTPGQGVLTILMGVMLLDFPGKRRLERKLIGRPKVLRAVNRLRARFGRPPVVLEPAQGQEKRAASEVS